MKKVTSFSVLCPECEDTIGTVTEREDPKRVGFYTNVAGLDELFFADRSRPAEIPGRCPKCDSFLARIPNY